MAYGTLSTLDTLASVRQSVIAFGEERAWDSIGALFEAHNEQWNGMLGALVERTTDARRSYGTSDAAQMDEMDQWGLADAQKITPNAAVDFPLRRYGGSLQWTRQWMVSNTVAQLAAHITAFLDADRANLLRQAKRAVYIPTNYTFTDKLGVPANVPLNVKAFANNDGSNYPVGPNGEVFATSHQHYLANATLTNAVANNLLTAVQEHYNAGVPVININSADSAAWSALTDFKALIDPRLGINLNANQPIANRLEMANTYNRMIGYFNAAEVWIKPWALANYAFAYVRGTAAPLAMRVPGSDELANFGLEYEDERHPLRARSYGRQFGIGVWQRVGGAVLQFNNGTYQTPTI